MDSLDVQLEALLFIRGEPTSVKELARLTGAESTVVKESLTVLQERLSGRGITLIIHGDSAQLATAPALADFLEKVRKEELTKDLGRAGSETLAIILYKGPVTRTDIDYIRGVNSAYIVRNLLVRGLIERGINPKDQRSYTYSPSLELLAYLGVTRVEDLPDFENVQQEIAKVLDHAGSSE